MLHARHQKMYSEDLNMIFNDGKVAHWGHMLGFFGP